MAEEINRCYRIGAFTASFVLSRKLIENLAIDLLRNKFPLNEKNLDIYYRPKERRFHDLNVLLQNLEDKKQEFGIDIETIEEFLKLVKPFKDTANSNTHSIIVFGDKEKLDKMQIEKMAGLLIRLTTNI